MDRDRYRDDAGECADADAFMRPLVEFDAMECWGELWARPGLSARDRSLVTVAILAAQSRFDELRTHVRGALTSGCSVEQLQEVLLHAGTYSGRDVMEESFRVAHTVLGAENQSRVGSPITISAMLVRSRE
jgi:4-carboxymuconolactone decarboxylase